MLTAILTDFIVKTLFFKIFVIDSISNDENKNNSVSDKLQTMIKKL